MMAIRLALILLSLILLSSCATPYQPMGLRGGYEDEIIDANTVQVLFAGNTHTPLSTVKLYLLLHCAEVTLAHNFSYFEVLHTYSDSLHGEVSLPRPYPRKTSAGVVLSGNNVYKDTQTYVPVTAEPIYQYSKPSVSATIRMYKRNSSVRGRYRYDARQLILDAS